MKLKLLLVLVLGFLLRIVFLNSLPPGITNDEMNIAINTQSILKTGTNIPGVVTGVVGTVSGDTSFGVDSELTSYLILPFIAVFGFSLISVKLPFILASLGIAIIGYLLTKKMFDERVALIAYVLLVFNPWLIFFGRTAYEPMISSFFYLLSILLIINFKGWKKLYSVPFLIAGFLCYFSAKTLIIPITLIASWAAMLLNRNERKRSLVVLNIIVFIFVGIYFVLLSHSAAGTRIGELKLSDSTQNVITKRTASLDSPFTSLFENKIVEELRIRIPASLGVLNSNYLFFNGQPEVTPSLSIPDHAFMYLIDLPLIILGIVFMANKFKKQLTVLLSLLVVTLIPNFLNLQGTTYSIRTVILFPILAIISAIGIYSLGKSTIQKIVIVVYAIFILNFCYIYFARLPVQRSEAWFLSERVLSRYVSEIASKNPDKKMFIVTEQPKLTFYKYLFYSGNYTNPEQIRLLNSNIENENYEIGNVIITAECVSKEPGIRIINTNTGCVKQGGAFIKSIFDAGDIYMISEDILCQSQTKNKYPLIKNIKALDIEKLTTEDFCKNYITDSR
jgi:hypothetical protein